MPPTESFTDSPESIAISHLTTSPTSSPTSTATTLAQPIESAFHTKSPTSDIEQRLWSLWNAVLHHAVCKSADPDGQQRLRELVTKIQCLPDVRREEDGAECTVFSKKLWSELPVFSAAMREWWDKKSLLDSDKASDPESQKEWVELNAFAAILTASAPSTPATDFSLYGLWTLREALEDPVEADEVPTAAVRAASVWFEYAAQRLWELSKEGKTFEGKVAREGKGFAGREWRGYGEERWQAWTERPLRLR
ncbi:hypothetical protein K490DRAFT_54700 [Saccharata proteae CBS 121410]|uniref:Uncharacterized protein n=1 Tax=Saccharata proteae CBS 121410 TaxID=1314787 RepID=A0A9P4HZH9_9PEZI|nr:hypothetical protein K490DRAFT_54700 [Saccharata proteae CBS 121410]